MIPMLEAAPLIAAGAILGVVAFTDLTEARIPNLAVALLIIAGCAQAYYGQDLAWHVGAAAVTFVTAFFLWQTDNLGGGDVKLLTACALVLGTTFPAFLAAVGAFAVCVSVSRSMLPKLWQKRRDVPVGLLTFPAFALVVGAQGGV